MSGWDAFSLVLIIQIEKVGDRLCYHKYPFTFQEDVDATKKKFEEIENMVILSFEDLDELWRCDNPSALYLR